MHVGMYPSEEEHSVSGAIETYNFPLNFKELNDINALSILFTNDQLARFAKHNSGIDHANNC